MAKEYHQILKFLQVYTKDHFPNNAPLNVD